MLNMIIAFITGLVLGTMFFGGLWLTVKKTVTSKKPVLLIFGSFLIRFCITLFGFYYISAGNWQRLLVSLSGFILTRFIVMYLTRLNKVKQIHLKKEVNHEA